MLKLNPELACAGFAHAVLCACAYSLDPATAGTDAWSAAASLAVDRRLAELASPGDRGPGSRAGFDPGVFAAEFARRPRFVDEPWVPDPREAEHRAAERAKALAEWALGSERVSACLGLNTWEGTTYFSKEGFESALAGGELLSRVERVVAETARRNGSTADTAPSARGSDITSPAGGSALAETEGSEPGGAPPGRAEGDAGRLRRDTLMLLAEAEKASDYRVDSFMRYLDALRGGTRRIP